MRTHPQDRGFFPNWGDASVCVAVLDGAADLEHPCFRGTKVTLLPSPTAAGVDSSGELMAHGTHVASVLFGQHGSEVEGLVKKFVSSTNGAGRKGEWKIIQEKLNEEMPSLNVMDFPLINGHQSNICATEANGLGVDQLQETWISKKSS